MKPPRWWNPTVASAVIVLVGFALALYGLAILNNYVNRRWGP